MIRNNIRDKPITRFNLLDPNDYPAYVNGQLAREIANAPNAFEMGNQSFEKS